MTSSLAKPQMVIYMRNGVEIWLDEEKAIMFGEDWAKETNKRIFIEGRFLNTVDIVGIFKPTDMEDLKKRKDGWFKCNKGFWHGKNEECRGHREPETDKYEKMQISEEQSLKNTESIKKLRQDFIVQNSLEELGWKK